MTKEALQAQLDTAPQFTELYKSLAPQEAQTLQDVQKLIAPQQAQLQLDLNKQFGGQQVEQTLAMLKQADPSGFAIREQLGKQVNDNLGLGNQLSAQDARNVEQNTRAEMMRRGDTTGGGLPGAFEEAIQKALAGEQRGFARRQEASSYLAGIPTPQQSGQALPQIANQTQQTQPFANLFPSTQQLINTERSRYGDADLYIPGVQQRGPKKGAQIGSIIGTIGGGVAGGFFGGPAGAMAGSSAGGALGGGIGGLF
jgi:hypothetical protein